MAMRVIAGSAGGIPLRSPRHGHVRPTMDQVRAAIFSSLAEWVEGARVLDLFAGTGALGIEALSRGATKATFVEKDRRTVECIRENLAKARLASGADVLCLDAFAYCTRLLRGPSPGFDLIFADPPYTTRDQPEDFAERLLADAGLANLLGENGVFVLEKSPLSPPPASLSRWQVIRQKRYGTAEVLFLRPAVESPLPATEGQVGSSPVA